MPAATPFEALLQEIAQATDMASVSLTHVIGAAVDQLKDIVQLRACTLDTAISIWTCIVQMQP